MKYQESADQIALVRWFKIQYPAFKDLLVSYPAGLNLGVTQRVRARAMGLKAGMPDLQLLIPTKHSPGLFIEMKTKKGTLSDVQKEFHEILLSQNYTITVCKGFEEGMAAIKNYLK